MQTLFGAAMRRLVDEAGASAAIVARSVELTFAQFDARSRACADWLVAGGLRAGESVGITIADEVSHLVVCHALLRLGVPQVTLPAFEPPAARRRLAERLRVTRVVAVDPSDALAGFPLVRVEPARLCETMAHVPAPLDADPDTVGLYVATSGTTGEPKLIAYTQRLLATRHAMRNFEAGERLYMPTTVETYPGKYVRLGALWRGCTSVLAESTAPSASEIAATCARHAVTRIDMGPLQVANLLEGGVEALQSGLKVFARGARVPMRMRVAFRRRAKARLYVEYGAREVGAGTSTYPVDLDEDEETVGRPSAGTEIEIVDADGRRLPAGEVGEIRMRRAGMVNRYHDDPSATARHFRDGWFHPGDLGWFSADGSLSLSGRRDDVINLNGIKIHPLEIERVLEDEPGVRVAAAFGLRSDLHGQIPVAALEWNGIAAPDPTALTARVRARLGVRAPRKLFIVERLPRNASGKIDKSALASIVDSASTMPQRGKP